MNRYPKFPELMRHIHRTIKTHLPGNRAICAGTLAVALAVLPWRAQALIINANYDSSVTSATNAAQIEAAYNQVIANYETLFTNPITINITVFWGGSSFGNSSIYPYGPYAYPDLTNALWAAATTSEDTNALASLPSSDPSSTGNWDIPRPELKMFPSLLAETIGVGANDNQEDGQVYFAPSFTSPANWTFDPLHRALANKYDFIAVAEHETSEVMGRSYELDQANNGYFPYDLFRFTNGVRTLNVFDSGVYFSVNNGVTKLKPFNTVTSLTIGSEDPQDWMPTNLTDSFDWELGPDVEGILSSADLTAMNTLGYELDFHPPKVTGTRQANGNFDLTFTNVSGLGFTVWGSTNIAPPATNWVKLGTPTETAVGQYQFIDTSANKTRFYRVLLQ